jgi:hypothetical protein
MKSGSFCLILPLSTNASLIDVSVTEAPALDGALKLKR